MTLPELYEYTKSKVKEMQETMPYGYGDILNALFLCRIGLEAYKTAHKNLGDQNEKMEILALPFDAARDHGNTP